MIHAAPSAVIFDLDGTLLDTLQDLADSMNAVLEEFGLPTHPADSYRLFVGEGVGNLVRRALPRDWTERVARADGFLDRCVEAMREQYELRWASRTAPYPGIPEMLRALDSRGVAMAVLSNKPDAFTRKIVGRFLGERTFRVVLGARDGVPRKPDPAGVLDILARLGTGAGATLYVGDSGTDMDTAHASGLVSVGVLWGFRGEAELRAHCAHHLVAEPGDLLQFFPARS